MDERKSDTSKLGIAIGTMAAMALVVAMILYLFRAKADVRIPEGIELTLNDKTRIMQVYNMVEAAGSIGRSDPDAGIKKALDAMKDIESLDGEKMESGFVFRKDSSPLLSAFAQLAALNDIKEDCAEAEKARGEILRVMETDYMVFPMRLVGPMTVMTGGEKFYAGAKKKNNEMLMMTLGNTMVNCAAGESKENESAGDGASEPEAGQ